MAVNFIPVDAKALANLLLDWADGIGAAITPLKLQKLTYYCHAEFLLATGHALIAQEFEAWEYGPVVPGVFHEFKCFGGDPIRSRAKRFDPVHAVKVIAPAADLGDFVPCVREAFDLYVRYSASTLSRMSHSSDGPWSEALTHFGNGKNPGRKIPNDLILMYHRAGSADSLH